MQIFALDECPKQSARWLCDAHSVKMVLESAQLLCNAHHLNDGSAPYKPTHLRHPCSIWASKSQSNYNWLLEHALTIADEYTARYGRIHKSQQVIEWCYRNYPCVPDVGLISFAVAIKQPILEQCHVRNDIVQTYRNYYLFDKLHFAKWKRNKPWWVSEYEQQQQNQEGISL